nr:MAG TPA: hypothetical protein [Caudoviricetes sp.]
MKVEARDIPIIQKFMTDRAYTVYSILYTKRM